MCVNLEATCIVTGYSQHFIVFLTLVVKDMIL